MLIRPGFKSSPCFQYSIYMVGVDQRFTILYICSFFFSCTVAIKRILTIKGKCDFGLSMYAILCLSEKALCTIITIDFKSKIRDSVTTSTITSGGGSIMPWPALYHQLWDLSPLPIQPASRLLCIGITQLPITLLAAAYGKSYWNPWSTISLWKYYYILVTLHML